MEAAAAEDDGGGPACGAVTAMAERARGRAVADLLTRSGRADPVATPEGQGGSAGSGDISGFPRPF